MKLMEPNLKDYPEYHVTRNGVVFSKRSDKWKVRKPSISNTNRLRVRMKNKYGDYKWEQVSRLVALAYIPNPNNLPLVMHLDNNPHNNHVSNLKWGTQSDNIKQAYNESRLSAPRVLCEHGEKHSCSLIKDNVRYMLIDLRLNYKVPVPKLSIIFGISKRHITKIIKDYKDGIRW